MEPIAESLEALTRLSDTTDQNLIESLRSTAERVAKAIPDCVGMSICHFDADITFTLLTTAERLRILDAAQYLDGGPCQVAALDGEEVWVDDLLDEDQWQLLALASAAHGVKSSLSLPLRYAGKLYGSANFYAGTAHGFQGREQDLARMFGAAVEEAVANADLSMSSLGRAKRAGEALDAHDNIQQAVGVLAVREAVSVDEAQRRLDDAANRAGVSAAALAELVLRGRVS